MGISTTATTTNERYWVSSGKGVKNPKWNDELVEQLKDLWKQGLSAEKIAKKLGFKSRNAVIGKLHRIGDNNGTRTYTPPKTGRPKLSRSEAISKGHENYKITQRINQRKHRERVRLAEDLAPMQVAPIEPHAFDTAIPLEQRRVLGDLHNYTCRWPIGDPGSTDFYFCGGPADMAAGKVYCKHHTGRARHP